MSKKKKPSEVSNPILKQNEAILKENTLVLKENFLKTNYLPLLCIGILSFALYFQSIFFDYALDDTMVIVKNKFTQQGMDGIGDIFRYESFRGYFGEQKQLIEGDRYRPLSIATFAVEQSLFGGNKAVSHFINILLYALTGFLMFRVLFLMFFNRNRENTEGVALWYFSVPFLATMLFLAHPLHVEVVANVKGRDELLALLGELGALYFTFKYLNDKKIKYLIGSFSTFFIAILSKESAITFIAIVPMAAHFFTKATSFEKLKVTLPVLVGAIVYVAMRFNAIGYLLGNAEITDLMNNPFYGMIISDKLATIFYTLLMYLKLLVFPHPLTHDYYPFQIPKMTWADATVWLSFLLHIGLGIVILRGWRRRNVWAFSAAFYLITLSIVSNLFVSVGTFMNERFVYHASFGFVLAFAYFLKEKLPKMPFFDKNTENTEGVKRAGMAIFVAAILAFSMLTINRVPAWKNGTTLNESAIKNSPNSARANCFFAISIWENSFSKLPKDASAERKKVLLDSMKMYFDKSVQILPRYNAAQKMRSGVAAEYFKLDGKIEPLIKVFDEANTSGTYDKFVPDFLKYVNGLPSISPSDAERLSTFYAKMNAFYKANYPNSSISSEYEKLLLEIKARIF